ncbi:tumor necrosis factor receptor superfamily member 1B isoform X1 [Haplochromis burtoni]|uniref:tumor necrosis factor receptor superfamily member 1B isoform X1 n=1 Tax=Haplochromis burtoni TaxID=8153 RepID=UPI0006C9624A|nr:tumor necrosis factor receptor superfamily member 1B isoform X1 [Haplochromis burtoni]XP_014189989.1 tumor necrosis factor receptor superfamily member 1B isoform X1 [Haplochromis burtoni]
MGLVQYSVALLMLSTQLVLSFPTPKNTYNIGGRECKFCPAGMYQSDCTTCEHCPAGSYTTDWNYEDECHLCLGDCNPKLHLKVVQNCTSTSDMKCDCEDGFRCIRWTHDKKNCLSCEKMPDPTPTKFHFKVVQNCTSTSDMKCDCEDGFRCIRWTHDKKNCLSCEKMPDPTPTKAAATEISVGDKHTPFSVSSGHTSTSPKPCQSPGCHPTKEPNPTPGHANHYLAAIFIPVGALATLALLTLFCVCRPRDETFIRQTIAKLWNEEGRGASHKSREPTHQFPRDSFSTKQQPSTPSAANLGPVHVHNPGTVIFSLLSQFTGQVGPTTECGKTAERARREEEDERNCPVFHPASSPSIHLSEEERSGENDTIFFPSQEQGKDSHMSKEEIL